MAIQNHILKIYYKWINKNYWIKKSEKTVLVLIKYIIKKLINKKLFKCKIKIFLYETYKYKDSKN